MVRQFGNNWDARRMLAGVMAAALVAGVVSINAQRRGAIGRGFYAGIREPAPGDFDGGFNFCRIWFKQNPSGDGGGWSADSPQADVNVSIRLSELTKTRVTFAGAEEPKHMVLQLTDPAVYQCPFIMMTEVGAAFFDPAD